jgi:hypothetical protein
LVNFIGLLQNLLSNIAEAGWLCQLWTHCNIWRSKHKERACEVAAGAREATTTALTAECAQKLYLPQGNCGGCGGAKQAERHISPIGLERRT